MTHSYVEASEIPLLTNKKTKPKRKYVQNHEKLHKELGNCIRIIESNNELKIPVARVCSEWLGSVSRSWGYTSSIDENSKRVKEFLMDSFPEHTWEVMPSQKPFDVVSLTAGIAIEIKSAVKGSNRLMSNASIYPNRIKASDIMSTNHDYPEGVTKNSRLDVLVLCVSRTTSYKVEDYAIVDGSYWGFTYGDYLNCNKFFNKFNNEEFKRKILDMYLDHYGSDTFIEKIVDDKFGNSLSMKFRKLITLTNPVGRLNTPGWWEIMR